MGILRQRLLICMGFMCVISSAAEPVPAQADRPWELHPDTWAAVDGLERPLPSAADTGPPRKNRTVGMFYFLWMGHHGDVSMGPFDISKLRKENPQNPAWGPVDYFHHWAEPVFGYYLSTDRFVIRKHLQMLSDAGVDVLIMDCTNGFTYPEATAAVFAEMDRRQSLGMHTPKVAFFANERAALQVWKDLYQTGSHKHHWFTWKGKPLLMVTSNDFAKLPAHFDSFFTLRKTWGLQPIDEAKEWSFLQPYPQHAGYETDPELAEFMSVSVAQQQGYMSDEIGFGRSSTHRVSKGPGEETFEGLNFQQQWDRALKVDPEFIFITGWNEWVAQRFIRGGKQARFVDQWSTEYSRDIEPMKGDHEDLYYYQLTANIRKYKGTRSDPPAVQRREIVINGDFSDWENIQYTYRDDLGDPVLRNHPGWGKAGHFRDRSGRNDLLKIKSALSGSNLCFYIQTREALTSPEDRDWMILYLDLDANAETGWLGYDLVVNEQPDAETASVRRFNALNQEWDVLEPVTKRMRGAELEIALPEKVWKMVSGSEIRFKVTDNIPATRDPRLFTLKGDAAPNDRFSYRLLLKSQPQLPTPTP